MVDQCWNMVKSRLQIGDTVLVRIVDRKPFGLLVAVDVDAAGVIERIGMSNHGYSLDDFEVGSTTQATVIGFRDWSKQVELRLPVRSLEHG